MIKLSTTNDLPGHDIVETIGLVRGSAVRSRHVFADFVEWLRNLFGMELRHYTKMMAETREQALDRMTDQALRQGATAIVGIRFQTTSMAAGSSDVLAYGTAVKAVPRQDVEAPSSADLGGH